MIGAVLSTVVRWFWASKFILLPLISAALLQPVQAQEGWGTKYMRLHCAAVFWVVSEAYEFKGDKRRSAAQRKKFENLLPKIEIDYQASVDPQAAAQGAIQEEIEKLSSVVDIYVYLFNQLIKDCDYFYSRDF